MRAFLLLVMSVSLAWSQSRTDLSLAEAVRIGLARNPDYQSTYYSVVSAKAGRWQAWALPSPTIEMAYEFVPLGAPLHRFDEKTAVVNQDFELPHLFLQKSRLSRREIEIAEHNRSWFGLDLTRRITLAYFQIKREQSLLQFAEENLTITQTLEKKIIARVQAGESPPLEAMTARVQSSQAQNTFERRKKSLALAVEELAGLLRMDIDLGQWTLTDSLSYEQSYTVSDSLLIHRAEHHPELSRAAAEKAAADLQIKLAYSSLWPTLNISYSRQSLHGDNHYYGFSLGATLPLWFGFEHRSKIQQAQAGKALAELKYLSTLNNRKQQIRKALYELHNAERELIFYRQELMPQVEETHRTALYSYDKDEISLLDYLQTRQMMISTREQAVDAWFTYQTALAQLRYETGVSF